MTMNDNDDAIVATSGLKRKDPPPLSVQVEQAAAEAEDEPRKVTPTAAAALSPYAFRMKELEEYGKAAGENYVMYQLSPRDIWKIFRENSTLWKWTRWMICPTRNCSKRTIP